MGVVLFFVAAGLGFALFVFAAIRAEGWGTRHLLWLGYCVLLLVGFISAVATADWPQDEAGMVMAGGVILMGFGIVGIWLAGALLMWFVGWESARQRRIRQDELELQAAFRAKSESRPGRDSPARSSDTPATSMPMQTPTIEFRGRSYPMPNRPKRSGAEPVLSEQERLNVGAFVLWAFLVLALVGVPFAVAVLLAASRI